MILDIDFEIIVFDPNSDRRIWWNQWLRSSVEISGWLTPFLMRMECEKIGVVPYEGRLRTLVEGIKPFVFHPGVKVLMTCFPVRPLRSSYYKVGDKQGCEVLAWTPASFYALCYHHANPEAIYIKGARLFFFYDSPEE
ncbi:hypothetical protein Bca4012_072663 [Brassica carinata]